jgi:hypothetical protein
MQNEMIRLKIDLTKLEKQYFFTGLKGTYVDLTMIPSRDSKYGDSHFLVQDVGQEARLQGIKGPIVGNAKPINTGQREPHPDTPQRQSKIDVADIPGGLPVDDIGSTPF